MYNQEDREKVLTELTKNLVVEAGAGTGKTTLLITRLCEAILVQEVAVEKLVALTFTEKAAAEIKTRLMLQLHELIEDLHQSGESKLAKLLLEYFRLKKQVVLERAEAALARLDKASIGTIHSFCADILKVFPLEAGLVPHAEIDSGYKAQRLFEARWNVFLDQELGIQAPRAALWKRVLLNISLPDLKTFAQELCSGKITHYDYFSHAAMLANLCEEKSRQALDWSTAFLAGAKKPRNSEKALSWASKSLVRSAAFLRKEPIPAAPEEEAPSFPSALSKGWEEDLFDQARLLVEFAQKITPENQALFLDALELVRPVADQVRQDYAQEGILSFDDLIVKTRNLLQQNLYVRRLLKEKFDFLCIDEFQDTDPVQGELLLFLAEEKLSSASRWQEVRLQPGKLLVVGDPKQSIYRFRGADITAYELFTGLILKQGGEKCFLQKNFRSRPTIVTVANEVCRRAMICQTAFQPEYVPIFPDKSPQENTVEWLFVSSADPEIQADDYRHNQGEQIARWIEQNVGKLTLSNGEKLTYGHIAILTRASTTCGPYTEALRRHAIAFNVETDKDFYRKQEISDFLNFLRVVENPEDRTALVGVLRSPWGGFTDEEIYQIVARGELSIYAKTKDPALARCYNYLQQFVEKAGRTPLKELLLAVLEETFLPEACAAAYDSERTVANLQRLVRIAQTYETPVTLGQFLAAVPELLQNEPERLGVSNVEDTQNAVSVMTVHKSKGLGFPVVILVDLSKKEVVSHTGNMPSFVFSWQYNMFGLRVGKIGDANLAFLEEEQKKHARCEEVRVLYVALTRAEEKMILVADGRKGASKAAAAFVQAGLFPDGQTAQVLADSLPLAVHTVPFQPVENFRYLSKPEKVEALSPEVLLPWKEKFELRLTRYTQLAKDILLSPSKQVEHSASSAQSQADGMEVGMVCHRALERLLSSPEISVEKALSQASYGLEKYAQAAAVLVQDFIQSPLWKEIKNCKVLATEMPFTVAEENGFQTGIIDAILEQPDGSIWVIDYKTDLIGPNDSRELLEKYRAQLTSYKRAVEKIFPGRSLRVSAVFVRAFAAEDL